MCINESKRIYPIYTKMAESLNAGEAIYQLKNAEEMRLKLIKCFQMIETQSGQILKYEPDTQNKDQLKLQRNIRFQSINFLKEHSFTLSQLPISEVYAKLKSQREVYLQEEMKRVEMEQLKQKNEINKRLNKKHSKQIKINNKMPNISIDNSNGWMPNSIQATAALFLESDSEDDENEDANDYDDQNGDYERKSLSSQKKTTRPLSDKEKALKIQIKLVEKYLEEALKSNKHDEAKILQKNLNELLNSLVDQ